MNKSANNSLVRELENYIRDSISGLDLQNSKLFFENLIIVPEAEDSNASFILKINGGLNGRGQFLFYLEDVEKLVKRLMCRFSDVWLMRWDNDAPDDVFDLEIGLRL